MLINMNVNFSHENFNFNKLIDFFLYNNMCVISINLYISQNDFDFYFYKLMLKILLTDNVVLKINVV